jgi:hypothetical protein
MLNDFLSKLPSTNYRIAVTVFLAVVTTARYVGWGIPGDNDSGWYAWLAFLGTMAGVDAWQFKKKRETEDPQMIVAHARARAIRESGVPAPRPHRPRPRGDLRWPSPSRTSRRGAWCAATSANSRPR